MVDLLIETLEPLGYPIILQGSMLADAVYPESFFTFWNDSADGASFYDNNENAITWEYSLNFYSVEPTLVNSVLLKAKNLLKSKGFTVSGAGHDVASDEPTHTGRGIDIYYREKMEG